MLGTRLSIHLTLITHPLAVSETQEVANRNTESPAAVGYQDPDFRRVWLTNQPSLPRLTRLWDM